jgi:ketosteroid isomerase-like protein
MAESADAPEDPQPVNDLAQQLGRIGDVHRLRRRSSGRHRIQDQRTGMFFFPTPLSAMTTLIDTRNAGDIDSFVACYEPEAVIVTPSGANLSGREGARKAAEGFLALNPLLTIGNRKIIEGASTALHLMEWKLQYSGPDGETLQLAGCTADVLRKQDDGGWLLAIDNPIGTDYLAGASCEVS